MSCPSANLLSIPLNVSLGSLPEGFCPASMQELAQAIATRLIITQNQAFTSFAAGSTAPTSNVGPWFRDCTELFIFDDATATYIPIPNRQFTRMEVFDVNSTWVNTFQAAYVMVEVWGGGGGGGTGDGGFGGGGGGGGGYGRSIITLAINQSIAVVVGTGGLPGAAGLTTSFSTVTATGGSFGGAGTGGGGGAGGVGGTSTTATEKNTGGSGSIGLSNIGGDGGDSPKGGAGGQNSGALVVGNPGIGPGGGGAGGTSAGNAGGAGSAGRVVIIY